MQLNHLHLSSSDVVGAAAFLCRHFGFAPLHARATRAFAALEGRGGFTLVLMELKPGESYPPMFHIGFLLPQEHAVRTHHEALSVAGADVGPLEVSRGGLRFYCKAPGDLLIEIGHSPN
jgi:hypothetical protein